jgi:tRNA1Val (adenine37-N6)-methyltransferase
MANSFFQFKQFMVHQDRCAMKVSTDAVVLGALAYHDKMNRILDVGTGTGVVALMLAQRYLSSSVHAVEIEEKAFEQAGSNVSASPWRDRMTIYNQSFQDFARQTKEAFDLIVSNPPYFPDHLQSPDPHRNLALHHSGLSFGDLIKGVSQILAPDGKFWVILPERQMQDLEKIVGFFHLYGNDYFELRDKPSVKVLRVIRAFSFQKSSLEKKIYYVRNEDSSYSEAYRNLLADFLLAF